MQNACFEGLGMSNGVGGDHEQSSQQWVTSNE